MVGRFLALAILSLLLTSAHVKPFMFGMYPDGGDPANLAGYPADFGATFIDLGDPNTAGYFIHGYNRPILINVMLNGQSCADYEQVLSGHCDYDIFTLAFYTTAYPNIPVMIAPFPEANGHWTWADYGSGDPEKFIAAFRYFRAKFEQAGGRAAWVFAPNGWSTPGTEFERYYPGGDVVDILGFSAFNFADCGEWQGYGAAVKPYLDRMAALDPLRPILLTQVGSLGTPKQRAAWLAEIVPPLKAHPQVIGLTWFNYAKVEGACGFVDWRIQPGDVPQGFGPADWGLIFASPRQPFSDLPAFHPALEYPAPVVLLDRGIVSGYPDGTYRPGNTITRAEMAVILLKLMQGANYAPPPAAPTFTDTGGHWAVNWIESAKAAGVIGGYPDGSYRPENQVTRAEMAVMIVRATHGKNYTPPNPVGLFADVPASHWAARFVEQLARDGRALTCPAGHCPDKHVTRGDLAEILTRE